MCEEIFGPVLTVFVYDDADWSKILSVVDEASPYALTGSVFATDRRAIHEASTILRNAAGNFYVNDKPTGAVVGQQPFGGSRGSGTNDKAGSKMNLLRWVRAQHQGKHSRRPWSLRIHSWPPNSEPRAKRMSVMVTNTAAEEARRALRREHNVEIVSSAQEGFAAEKLPEGFTDLRRLPRWRLRCLRTGTIATSRFIVSRMERLP